MPTVSDRKPNAKPNRVKKELTVLNLLGLHARPAVQFVRCVLSFKSTIHIFADGRKYIANRIMEVLLAKLDHGKKFTLEAEGVDAEKAVQTLEALLIQFAEEEKRPQDEPPGGGKRKDRMLDW